MHEHGFVRSALTPGVVVVALFAMISATARAQPVPESPQRDEGPPPTAAFPDVERRPAPPIETPPPAPAPISAWPSPQRDTPRPPVEVRDEPDPWREFPVALELQAGLGAPLGYG